MVLSSPRPASVGESLEGALSGLVEKYRMSSKQDDSGNSQQEENCYGMSPGRSNGLAPQFLGNQSLVEAAVVQENQQRQQQEQLLAQQLQSLGAFQQLQAGGLTGNMSTRMQAPNVNYNQLLWNSLMLNQQQLQPQVNIPPQQHLPLGASLASLNSHVGFPNSAAAAVGGHGGFNSTMNAAIMLSRANTGAPAPSAVFGNDSRTEQGGYNDASVLPDPVMFNRNGVNKDGRKVLSAEPFPQKLHRVLSELGEEPEGADIASFLSHGRAFAIHNPKKFLSEVMPKYFRMSRFSSFQRQLNLYDFRRVAEGRDKGAYYHELFLKGRPALSTQMKRTKIKGHQGNKLLTQKSGASHRNQVDFYTMPPIQSSRPAAAAPVAPTLDNGDLK